MGVEWRVEGGGEVGCGVGSGVGGEVERQRRGWEGGSKDGDVIE